MSAAIYMTVLVLIALAGVLGTLDRERRDDLAAAQDGSAS